MKDLPTGENHSGMDLDALGQSSRDLILIVEDNPDTIFLLKQILINAGFNVISALDGEEGIKKAADYTPDLILLDIMMPQMDGWEAFTYFRKMMDVPIIIISALEQKEDIVMGFRKGIDDYITKPFYNAEVVERIRAVLRRRPSQKQLSQMVYPQSDLEIDIQNLEVCYQGERIRLTPREFAVFSAIAKQAPNLVSYSTIMQAVWGEDNDDTRKRMKYLVYLIRKKLDQIAPGREFLENVDRVGYRLLIES